MTKTKALAIGLLAAALGLFGGLAMHDASADPQYTHSHTRCNWHPGHSGYLTDDKALTESDLYVGEWYCDTDYS